MRSKEGGHNVDAGIILKLAVHPKQSKLGILVEPVTTLAFDGRYAQPDDVGQKGTAALEQLLAGQRRESG